MKKRVLLMSAMLLTANVTFASNSGSMISGNSGSLSAGIVTTCTNTATALNVDAKVAESFIPSEVKANLIERKCGDAIGRYIEVFSKSEIEFSQGDGARVAIASTDKTATPLASLGQGPLLVSANELRILITEVEHVKALEEGRSVAVTIQSHKGLGFVKALISK